MTDEVSSLTASGFGIGLFGDDVEMVRLDDACIDGLWIVLELPLFSFCNSVAGWGCTCVTPLFAVTVSGGLICVCILVLTTSSGHVITPASPPADAAVASSRPIPRSVLPFHLFAQLRSCS